MFFSNVFYEDECVEAKKHTFDSIYFNILLNILSSNENKIDSFRNIIKYIIGKNAKHYSNVHYNFW